MNILFLSQDPIQNTTLLLVIMFSLSLPRLCFSHMILTVLRSTGQVFCKMSPKFGLFNFFLIIRLGSCQTNAWHHTCHHIISGETYYLHGIITDVNLEVKFVFKSLFDTAWDCNDSTCQYGENCDLNNMEFSTHKHCLSLIQVFFNFLTSSKHVFQFTALCLQGVTLLLLLLLLFTCSVVYSCILIVYS